MTTRAVKLLRCALVPVFGLGLAGCPRAEAPTALLRVDQVGYAPGETKIAVLLAPRDAAGVRAGVVDDDGAEVMPLTVGASRGAWNAAFRDIRPIDLTGLRRAGTYRVRVTGAQTGESPPFRVAPAADLFAPLARDSLHYFRAHRDGADQVPGPWRRQAAHLSDRRATVHERPAFDDTGRLTAGLVPVDGPDGGPVDVEGGWYDAGDFLKFTHTTAYALIAMSLVQRDGLGSDGLAAEIRHGADWLDKMWDARTGTLHTQVGIGGGRYSGDGGFLGDHDTWRLPEDDDRLPVEPGDDRYYQRYRPVFRTGGPGELISPNLAGRVAAAFALVAQTEAATEPERAREHLEAAAQIFARARVEDVGDLVTAEPRAFYPESRWADDLAAGATELALAGRLLGDSRTGEWALTATRWARTNVDEGGDAVLSVYDLSAVADAELVRLLDAGAVPGAAVDRAGLLGDLRRRLADGERAAAGNPMRAAAGNGGPDYASRQLGQAATAELYEHVSGDARYAAFATTQRGVVLGANGWGASLVVGAGTAYPRCPHDQIATLTRTVVAGPVMTGAVVNGPHRAERVRELLGRAGPVACGSRAYAAFDTDDARYTDDTRVSANTEASIDFSATGMLAFALMAARH